MTCRPPPWPYNGFPVNVLRDRAMAAGANTDVTCTSWFRTGPENAAVGGDDWSQHLVGWALDAAGPEQQAFAKRARMTGLIAVLENDHVHLQLFPASTLRRLYLGY